MEMVAQLVGVKTGREETALEYAPFEINLAMLGILPSDRKRSIIFGDIPSIPAKNNFFSLFILLSRHELKAPNKVSHNALCARVMLGIVYASVKG